MKTKRQNNKNRNSKIKKEILYSFEFGKQNKTPQKQDG
jgi:hypothetical protein